MSGSDAALKPETLALIGAAVALALEDKPHRIMGVRELTLVDAPPNPNPWAMLGRFQIFDSHKVR